MIKEAWGLLRGLNIREVDWVHYFNFWSAFAGIFGLLSVVGNIVSVVAVVYLALTVPKYLQEITQRLAQIENRLEAKQPENGSSGEDT